MWVCLCKGVNDRQIRAAINAGARTPEEISERCRAATGCGGCLPEVCRLLADHLAREAYFAQNGHERVPTGVGSRQT
jgi:bacterioferritin-associated ferredoxin